MSNSSLFSTKNKKKKRLSWAECGEVAIRDLWAERVADLREST